MNTLFKSEKLLQVFNEYQTIYNSVDVKDNEQIIINATSVYFFQLRIGHNARIIIDPSLDYCNLRIDNFTSGSGCEIIGDGANGASGARQNPNDPWLRGWWQAGSNDDGGTGVQGLDGERGKNGRPLNIKLGIISIGTLAIHSFGGHGGNGGNGGNGQVGGNRSNPITGRSGFGGNGGRGGNAGTGGNGGSLNVDVWAGNGSVDMSLISQFISLYSRRGNAGTPGLPGEGSPGGNNTYSGERGAPGIIVGPQGVDGQTVLNVITPPEPINN